MLNLHSAICYNSVISPKSTSLSFRLPYSTKYLKNKVFVVRSPWSIRGKTFRTCILTIDSITHQSPTSIYHCQFYNALRLAQCTQRITRIIVYGLNWQWNEPKIISEIILQHSYRIHDY